MYDLYMHMGKVPETRGRGCRSAPYYSNSSDAKVFVLCLSLSFLAEITTFSEDKFSNNVESNALKP